MTTMPYAIACLPLFERILALAHMTGEKLRSAVYEEALDAGATEGGARLTPDSSDGPFVAHGIGFRGGSAFAADDVFTLIVNGTTYADQVCLGHVFVSPNAPIVIETAQTMQWRLRMAAGNVPASSFVNVCGFHCSDAFARFLRKHGEYWHGSMTLTGTATAELRPSRRTLVEYVAATDGVTLDNLQIRLGNTLLTPSPISIADPAAVLAANGFARQGPQTGAPGQLSGRMLANLRAEDRIQISQRGTGAVTYSVIGRQIYV